VSTDRLNQLLDLLEKDPKDSFLIFAIAKEYESIPQLDNALQYYLQLKRNDPDYIGLYYHLGKLYEGIGHNNSAIEHYKKGIEIGKRISDFHAVSELQSALMNLEITLGN